MTFLANLINFETLLPLALFGMFAALAWWALDLVAAGKPRAVERLDELKNPRKARGEEHGIALTKADRVTKVLAKASPALAKPLQPKSEMELGKLRTKLANAGFRSEAAGSIFLGLKFVGLVGGLLLSTGTILPVRG